MNKFGIHAYVWTPNWTPTDAEFAIRSTAELGYDYIEASTMDFAKFDVKMTKDLLTKYKIGINISFGLSANMDITSSDQNNVKRGEQYLLKAVTVARDVGAQYMCGILYSAFQKYSEPPTKAGIAQSIAVIQRVAKEAQKYGITLGLEVVNRYETNVLNTSRQAIDFVKRVNMPNVKIHLDTYHLHIEEADPAAAIREAGDFLGYFHLGDSHRGYLGAGSVNFPEIFRALQMINYQGPIAFESFSSKVIGQPLEGILAIWRDLWEDGRDLATHAKAFSTEQYKCAEEALRVRSSN